MQEIFRGIQIAWNKFIEPSLKLASPIISAAVAAKKKNPQSAPITSNIIKSLTGGKILSLTDMHGNELTLEVMWFKFNQGLYNKKGWWFEEMLQMWKY